MKRSLLAAVALCLTLALTNTATARNRIFVTQTGQVVQIRNFRNVARFTAQQNFQFQQNFVNRNGFVQRAVTNVPVFFPAGQRPRRVRVDRNGRRQRFDFGRFKVEVRVKRDGRVVVDYDD